MSSGQQSKANISRGSIFRKQFRFPDAMSDSNKFVSTSSGSEPKPAIDPNPLAPDKPKPPAAFNPPARSATSDAVRDTLDAAAGILPLSSASASLQPGEYIVALGATNRSGKLAVFDSVIIFATS